MSTIINTRSPFYYKKTPTTSTISSAEFEIRIWSGLDSAVPTPADYTITKVPIDSSYVVIEVSELIRDYYETSYGTSNIEALWVEISYTLTLATTATETGSDLYLALDGYGMFEEGVNPRNGIVSTDATYTPTVLLSCNSTMQFIQGRKIHIPVFIEQGVAVASGQLSASATYDIVPDYWDATATAGNLALSQADTDDTDDKISYIVIDDTENISDGDTLTITDTLPADQTYTITFEEICEPKYEAYRVIFKNKFGALQDVWMNKKSVKTMSVNSESYKRNTLTYSTPTYSTTDHQTLTHNISSVETIKLNSNYIPECLNSAFEELLLSDQIWLESSTETLPVIIKTKRKTEKTGVNDKLIQYELEFDFAFEQINNIR